LQQLLALTDVSSWDTLQHKQGCFVQPIITHSVVFL
jgi:hypothetical protein